MSFVVSPNMNLPIPVVGNEPGPQYATDVNNSLTLVDSHNHSAGSGVQITPNGLDINIDLPMNNNSLISIGALTLTPQLSDAIANSLYEKGVDLYYRDGSGNVIRITQSGSVSGASGTITGLPSGTASASYAAGTFTFQSATNTAANIDAGSYIFRNNTALSNGITLQPPNALGSNYSLTLPALPPGQQIMTLDAAGNMAAPYTVDNASLTIISNVIQVAAQGIQATALAPKPSFGSIASAGQVAKASTTSSQFSTSATSFVDVPGLSVTLTSASGRPIKLVLTSDASGNATNWSATGTSATLRFVDSTNTIEFGRFTLNVGNGVTANNIPFYGEVFDFLLNPASSRTYKIQIQVVGSATILSYYSLIAYEI